MKRGDVYWLDFPAPNKRRPVLIITRDTLIRYLNEVTVVPITTTVRGVPSEIVLGSEEGMPAFCAANFLHIQTVNKKLLIERITTLLSEKCNS